MYAQICVGINSGQRAKKSILKCVKHSATVYQSHCFATLPKIHINKVMFYKFESLSDPRK